MKLKTLFATLLGTILLQSAAFCQTNVVQPDQPAVAAVTNEVAADDATNAARRALLAMEKQGTNTAAADSVTNAPAVADTATNQPAVVVATNAPVEVVAAEAAASTNSAAAEAVSIPLIQFQEVPITTAIENLARQANINYLMDPKIAYGQPEANGQIKPEPTLSIRWENITAEHALTALLDNYGLQMVSDQKTKIVRITAKDPTAPPKLVTRVIQLKYSSVSNMMSATEGALTDKRSKVVPDTRTSQLIVVATEPEQASVDALVNQLDRPTRQVLIETRLVEISQNPDTRKGIDWRGSLQAQHLAFGNSSQYIIQPTAGSTTTAPNGTTLMAVS